MLKQRAFTVVKLLVIVLGVAILAVITVPAIRGGVEEAKWAEGRAAADTLGAALNTYAAAKGNDGTYGEGQPSFSTMGYSSDNFSGTYFDPADFTWTTNYDRAREPKLHYTIVVSPPRGTSRHSAMVLDHTGRWTEMP
ncbi:MAG: hypothetical protein IH624_14995 [Phycisphaerae bacterium]|nr:hypothetical protein [Phycisphaerae bacterium]